MKTFSIQVLLLAAAGAFAAETPLPPELKSVSIDVKAVASKMDIREGEKKEKGGRDKSISRERVLEITARTSNAKPAEVVLTTWWLGKPVSGGEMVLLKKAQQQVQVANAAQKFEVSSGAVEERNKKPEKGERQVEGLRIAGWIVTVQEPATNRLVTYRLSEVSYESLLKPAFKLADLKPAGEEPSGK